MSEVMVSPSQHELSVAHFPVLEDSMKTNYNFDLITVDNNLYYHLYANFAFY